MIEPRIYSLLQTLAAADLDWLSREILDGLTAGRVAAASPEQMELARKLANRRDQYAVFAGSEQFEVAGDKPFTNDEQINYAADYTVARLTDVIKTMETSLGSLERLLKDRDPLESGTSAGTIMLSLDGADSTATTSMEDLRLAKDGLGELRNAVMIWRNASKIDGGTQ